MTSFQLLRWSLRAYEYGRFQDVTLFPWRLIRWFAAWVITQILGWWRYFHIDVEPNWRRVAAFSWGRHDSPEPIMCRYCLWAGMTRECYHGYAPCGDEDVEPMDYCPRCDGEI